jgi:hypothetical protein
MSHSLLSRRRHRCDGGVHCTRGTRAGLPYDELDYNNYTLPDFIDLTMVLFPKSDMDMGRPMSSWRLTYLDFSYHGKAAALRFGLACLLSDLYGGEDDAVAAHVNALSETLAKLWHRQWWTRFDAWARVDGFVG